MESQMSVYRLILSRRSIRQFQPKDLGSEMIKKLINGARLAPSGANLQPLEFVVVDHPGLRDEVFSCLRWAGYIAPRGNPEPGKEPRAYVVVLVNTEIRAHGYERDVGAAVENMILVAWEKDIGSCWIGSFEEAKLRVLLHVPKTHVIDSVLALGYPAEHPVIEKYTDSVEYWKDEQGQHHVPKRPLESVMYANTFGGRVKIGSRA